MGTISDILQLQIYQPKCLITNVRKLFDTRKEMQTRKHPGGPTEGPDNATESLP